jgi:hypothetical protein
VERKKGKNSGSPVNSRCWRPWDCNKWIQDQVRQKIYCAFQMAYTFLLLFSVYLFFPFILACTHSVFVWRISFSNQLEIPEHANGLEPFILSEIFGAYSSMKNASDTVTPAQLLCQQSTHRASRLCELDWTALTPDFDLNSPALPWPTHKFKDSFSVTMCICWQTLSLVTSIRL